MVEYVEGRVALHIIAGDLTRPASPTPSTTTTVSSLRTMTSPLTLTTAMQMLPLTAEMSFEHRRPQCLLIPTHSTSPP